MYNKFPILCIEIIIKLLNSKNMFVRRLLAKLEGADRAFCFSSGMAALSTVTHLARAGKGF